MKTEAEALKTRCCGPEGCGSLQSTMEPGRSYNTEGVLRRVTRRYCIATGCMGWNFGGFRHGDGTETVHHDDLKGTVTRVGYCGLAGKP